MNKLSRIIAAFSTVALVGWAVPAVAAPAPVTPDGLRMPAGVYTAPPANSIQGYQIKDGTLYGSDLAPALIPWFTNTYNNTVGRPALKADVAHDLDTTKMISVNADPQQIGAIGGPIKDNGTQLSPDLVVQPGSYKVEISGQIDREVNAATPGKGTQPQISLWLDLDNDGVFEWQDGEGSISPNCTIPDLKDRSCTVSGFTKITLTEATHFKLIAHGLDNDGSGAGSNELAVVNATLALTPTR